MAFDRMVEMLVRMEDAPQLRVYNIKDPVQLVESGWFVPPDPDKECRAAPKRPGDADRGRAGGYPRLRLRHRQELGRVDFALSRAGSAGTDRPVTFR